MNKLKPLIKHKLQKERKYYRIAGLKSDHIQFHGCFNEKRGYINLTKDIQKHGYKIVSEW